MFVVRCCWFFFLCARPRRPINAGGWRRDVGSSCAPRRCAPPQRANRRSSLLTHVHTAHIRIERSRVLASSQKAARPADCSGQTKGRASSCKRPRARARASIAAPTRGRAPLSAGPRSAARAPGPEERTEPLSKNTDAQLPPPAVSLSLSEAQTHAASRGHRATQPASNLKPWGAACASRPAWSCFFRSALGPTARRRFRPRARTHARARAPLSPP